MKIAVLTTFPNEMYEVYGKEMIQSFVKFWPEEVPLLVQLDDETLYAQVGPLARPQDAIAFGWEKEHAAFVERNKGKDHSTNYRKQAVRFCHKVFAIKRAVDAISKQKASGGKDVPRYLIWMDADVITTRKVTLEDIEKCLPKEGDAVAYLGRKDWDHSECGWLAFDLDNGGEKIVDLVYAAYKTDSVFGLEQWHDSWVWDFAMIGRSDVTNLTKDKPGQDIWPHSPMAAWSRHYKGPDAKKKLAGKAIHINPNNNFSIQTLNALPNEQLHEHIRKNQKLIKNWIRPCKSTDEELIVVSAGPQLIAEDLRSEKGKRIVAVKHAVEPLRKAGIKPWACILLDPRPHVLNFVTDADKDIIWFVASQVNPEVTMELLSRGCTVWGYHASVGANEGFLTKEQEYAIVSGGSATSTRGLYMLNHLGFKNFTLYGYDLCVPDKPDLDAKDDRGQPKFMEISLGMNDPSFSLKKCFWSIPELIAQYEEICDIIHRNKFNLKAIGEGIVPFILKCYNTSNLRNKELRDKIAGENPPTYNELMYGTESSSRPVLAVNKRKSTRNRRRAS